MEAVLAWRHTYGEDPDLRAAAIEATTVGEVKPGLLRFPVWPARWAIAFGFAVLIVEYVARVWEEWHAKPPEVEGPLGLEEIIAATDDEAATDEPTDGPTEEMVRMSADVDLTIAQALPFSGATFSVTSELQRYERTGTQVDRVWTSSPVRFQLDQPIFRANDLRWDGREAHVELEAAERQYLENREGVAHVTPEHAALLENTEFAQPDLHLVVATGQSARKIAQIIAVAADADADYSCSP